jgi:hypothetical protein
MPPFLDGISRYVLIAAFPEAEKQQAEREQQKRDER